MSKFVSLRRTKSEQELPETKSKKGRRKGSRVANKKVG